MPFQKHLDGLINKGKAKLKEFTGDQNQPPAQNQYPQQQYQQPGHYQQHQYQQPNQYQQPQPQQGYGVPPPIPYGSRPGGAQQQQGPNVYWQAAFNPQTPVNQIFEQETGDHGWGNNESQNYTSEPQNSFFTPDNKLVIRGIVQTSAPSNKYTSARLITHQKLDRQRGCLSAVVSAPCAPGIWPAFWLLPKKPFAWPTDGEVDIFESWNGDCVNHSCLHWGHFNGEDSQKHRVVDTPIPSMAHQAQVMAFAWDQPEDGRGGRMVWYINGGVVMKADIPPGTRRLSEWNVILNVAMGGNVCGGKLPGDGQYDFVVHELKLMDEPLGGWNQFGADWQRGREGKTM
ncbi:related to endo-1,3-beta-glucanase [Rhynchosporium secalis]|uniref:Related to endo-1,3-beta-glucanase n=1 Tax=Rhynchosporium secalis TaxID=38038 RepID=A0A1E1MW30_RHYSE|nr:related to endo-1,3-beta-glucanase [Rhynchosporium secalis]